jgi:transketolase
MNENLPRQAVLNLLEIKDSDIRISILEQCHDAVDKGLHSGGAFSAVVPLVSLFYGGIIQVDVERPTRLGQDIFVLSKGHAVATLASIYADLGYFDRDALRNSRSVNSILKGHPGPSLPGVQVSTGPLGQGFGVAQGFALAGKRSPPFDVFCMVGDGELQEGTPWETAMFAGANHLDNLCLLVDNNGGQLDDPKHLIFPMEGLAGMFQAFGWNAIEADATGYGPVLDALDIFKHGSRDGRPMAIICHARKGQGMFSDKFSSHKVTMDDELFAEEMALQQEQRASRVQKVFELLSSPNEDFYQQVEDAARSMNLAIKDCGEERAVVPVAAPVRNRREPVLDKKIAYDPDALPRYEIGIDVPASKVITAVMSVLALDERIVSVDADIASASGLQAGIAEVDAGRAINAGIAEANMMCIGEAFAALGYNAWVSTFCPFFNWQAMRRIAIGFQERMEQIASPDGWLSEGHGIDLTFVATAPDFETVANGATHMGNDDKLMFATVAHLKIVDVECANLLVAAIKWIAEGNKGLVYLRIPRSPARTVYPDDVTFEYGKGYVLKESGDDRVAIIASGREVTEALTAASILQDEGIPVRVIDMPSIDRELMLDLYRSMDKVFVTEQNNGYILSKYKDVLFSNGEAIDPLKIIPINTLDQQGEPRFIHSGTYQELIHKFGLSAEQLVDRIKRCEP